MNQDNADQLAYWINERYKLFLTQKTDDPIMLAHRFGNVFRETDKATEFIRAWAKRDQYLTPMLVLARLFNTVYTLRLIEWPQKMDQFWFDNNRAVIKGKRDAGRKIFSAAYFVSTPDRDKVDDAFDIVAEVHRWEVHPMPGDTLASFAERLRHVRGVGSFLVAQLVADLKNTHGNDLAKAADWWTWNTLGPGSLRGLARIYGDARAQTFNRQCQDLYAHIVPQLTVPRLCMQDFQNCLNEFDKWKRLKDGK